MARLTPPRPGRRFRPRLEALEDRLPPGDVLALAGAGAGTAYGGASARGVNPAGRWPDGQPAEALALLAPAGDPSRDAEGAVTSPAPSGDGLSRMDYPSRDRQGAVSLTAPPGDRPSRDREGAVLPPLPPGRGSDGMMAYAATVDAFIAAQPAASLPPGLGQWLGEAIAASATPPAAAHAPLRFDPATGQLAVHAGATSDPVREAISARGFAEVTLAGRVHSADPTAAAFDPALAGATAARLAGVRVDGGAGLSLDSQATAGGLAVQADGPVTVAGSVTAAGPVAIAAPAVTVRGTLRGAAVDLAAAGLVNVAARGSIAADRVGVTAGVFVNAGGVHADGVNGGTVAIHARNALNGGRITADGQAEGGAVQVRFTGSYLDTAAAVTAADGATGGRVAIDGGPSGRLFSSGTHEALGRAARAGSIALHGAAVLTTAAAPSAGLTDPHPGRGGLAGLGVVALPNGNVLVAKPHDDFAAPDGGAVYLLDGRTGGLLGALVGGEAGDRLGDASTSEETPGRLASRGPVPSDACPPEKWPDGSGGHSVSGSGPDRPDDVLYQQIIVLRNGNYVVESPFWNNTRGAATWGDGTAGVTGVVDDTNSLVGSDPGDYVSGGDGTPFGGISTGEPLSNGNYVVASPRWNGNRGAVTWGDGAAGVAGVVSPANSLVGSNAGEYVGFYGIAALGNGNYVVPTPIWNGRRGAATWGDGNTGITGTISAMNSLVGSNPGDRVGSFVTPLSNGNYVVGSPDWNGVRGAATWGTGDVGIRGPVDPSNSLVGTDPNDSVGGLVWGLTNGNYVVSSTNWNGTRGAATWGDGTAGTLGTIDPSNSLIGSHPGDYVGGGSFLSLVNGRVDALPNGNYVVLSTQWNGGRGAATWGDGTTGITGVVDASNSLVGSSPNDHVGAFDLPLANGNYVLTSEEWKERRGAATWGDGTAGITGTIDATNSLVGSNPGDRVGYGVKPLSNGNYVVESIGWNERRGAVTWADGTAGIGGVIDSSNSLIGSYPGDSAGLVWPLSNGNYVVISGWNGRGAATWADGTTGVTGTVNADNSFVGADPGEGPMYVAALVNGNYVLSSTRWNNGRGAVTWADGAVGMTGTADTSNSLVGTNPGDSVGFIVRGLANGNYVVDSRYWNDQRGAATWADGRVMTTGTVDATNSLVGTSPMDQVGVTVPLSNGNYVVMSPQWDGGRGAATWGDGVYGSTVGPVDESNSLVG